MIIYCEMHLIDDDGNGRCGCNNDGSNGVNDCDDNDDYDWVEGMKILGSSDFVFIYLLLFLEREERN